MTISTTTNRVKYNCDGATVDFVFNFPITAKSDLTVIHVDSAGTETTLALTTNYTISAGPWTSGGTVTTLVTYPATDDILIKRILPLTQDTDYVSNDPFPAETHEAALDKLTMIDQQIQEDLDRSIKLQESSTVTDVTIVDPVADEFLKFNSTADGIDSLAGTEILFMDSTNVDITGGTINGTTIGDTNPAPGTFSTLTSPLVTITGGTISGITDLAVADGGTGASTAAGARTNLDLYSTTEVDSAISALSSVYQPLDAGLTDISGLAVTDSNFIVGDGVNWVAESGATARTSLDVYSTSEVDSAISAVAGTYVDVTGDTMTGDLLMTASDKVIAATQTSFPWSGTHILGVAIEGQTAVGGINSGTLQFKRFTGTADQHDSWMLGQEQNGSGDWVLRLFGDALADNSDPTTQLFEFDFSGNFQATGIIESTGTTYGLKTNSIKIINTENDGTYYTDEAGMLTFDENFYGDTNYGTATGTPYDVFNGGGNGGGILIKNEDGWGAVLTSQNTRWADSTFRGLTTSSLDLSSAATNPILFSNNWTIYNNTATSTILTVVGTSGSEFDFYSDGVSYTTAKLTIGGDLILDSNGTTSIPAGLSVTGNIAVTGTVDGRDVAADGTVIDGLGTISTQDSNNVSITGGSITGITDLAVADGGTGASTASGARTNLGVAIGSDVQAWDADLDAIAALAKTDSNFIVGNGTTWVAETGATARTSLGLTIGTDVQAYDATLAALAGLATGANKVPYSTGTDTFGQLDFLDEDTMTSDSATAVASQQSIKAYVDATVSAGGTIPNARRQIVSTGAVDSDGNANYIGTTTHYQAYSDFDGSDAATSFTDANGEAWTFNGNAQLDTADYKFGTSSLLLDGTGDYVQSGSTYSFEAGEQYGGFEMSMWFKASALNGTLWHCSTDYHIALVVNASGYLYFLLGNGGSWSIANTTSTVTACSTGTWYRVRLVWDGYVYKIFLSNNGAAETLEIAVKSETAFASNTGEFRIGVNSSAGTGFNGWVDDHYYTLGTPNMASETPSASAASAGFETDAFSLALPIYATTTPVTVTYAAGGSSSGDTNYIDVINADADSVWSSLTANAECYLYRTYATGYGFTENLPPIYGKNYKDAQGVGIAYSNFEGTSGDTYFVDECGTSWTFTGNAALSSTQAKFGSTSVYFDGAGDYITSDNNLRWHYKKNGINGFVVDLWAYPTTFSVGGENTLWCINVGWGPYIVFDASGYLKWYLTTASGGWNISNGLTGTTAATLNAWNHVRFQWDGTTYKAYLNGTEELTVTNSGVLYGVHSYMRMGAQDTPNHYFSGYLDDFSFELRPVTHGSFTPPTTARGGLQADGEHWFDTNLMKMQYWDRSTGAWVTTNRVFMGECTTDSTKVTSTRTYQLNGHQEYYIAQVTKGANHTITHSIGSRPTIVIPWIENRNYENSFSQGYRYHPMAYASNGGGSNSANYWTTRDQYSMRIDGSFSTQNPTTDNNISVSNGYEWVGVTLDRGW